MTIREIFSKGKTANIHKLTDCGKCATCGKAITEEDMEVGFYGTKEEWQDYENEYVGYLDLDEELELVNETATEVECNSYYQADAEQAEYKLYKKEYNSFICYPFCSEECQNKAIAEDAAED